MYKVNSRQGISILSALVLVSGLAGILGRMVAIALPSIQIELNANFSDIQWVINANLIMVSVFTLISGLISDRFGIKRIFILGIIVFSTGCIIAAISNQIQLLITSQAIVGLGMVLMVPSCLAIINMTFIDDDKARAIGIWIGIGAFFGVIGLLVGGVIIESWGWRMAFSVIAILGLFTVIFSFVMIPQLTGNKSVKIVPINIISLAVGLVGLSYALIYGPKQGWFDNAVLMGSLMAIFGLAIFVYQQKTSDNPLIPKELLCNSRVVWSNVITFLLYFTLNGLYVFGIVAFQKIYDYSPTESGLALIPPSFLVAIFAGPLGRYSDRIGSKKLIYSGSMLTALGFYIFSLQDESSNYYSGLLLPLLLIGFGMVFFVTPVTKGATSVHIQFSGSASSLNNTVARIAGLMAIALLGSIWAISYTSNIETQISQSSLSEIVATSFINQIEGLKEVDLSKIENEENKIILKGYIKQSLSKGFSLTMFVCSILSGLAALSAILFLKGEEYQS